MRNTEKRGKEEENLTKLKKSKKAEKIRENLKRKLRE